MKESLLRSWIEAKILCWVTETFYSDETNPKTDLTDPHIKWRTFFVQMETGFMRVVCD